MEIILYELMCERIAKVVIHAHFEEFLLKINKTSVGGGDSVIKSLPFQMD